MQIVPTKPILNILKLNQKDATSEDLKGNPWTCTDNVTPLLEIHLQPRTVAEYL